jgi:hypothetical protein
MSVKQVLKDVLFGHHPQQQQQQQQGTTGTTGTTGAARAVMGAAAAAASTLASNLERTTLGPTPSLGMAQGAVPLTSPHLGGTMAPGLGQGVFNVLPENVQVNALPAQVVCQEKPPVIREIVHPSEKHEVNPIIYREREQTEIRQVEQPIYETLRRPTIVIEKALPAENRPVIQPQATDFDLKYREGLDKYKSSVEYAPVETETITKPPVVIETIRKHVREEIQPVIFREIYEPHVIKETRPIYEKIIEAPTLFRVSKQPLQKGEVFLTSDTLPQTTGYMGQNVMGQSTTPLPSQYSQQIPIQSQPMGQFLPKTTNVEISEARPFMGTSSS